MRHWSWKNDVHRENSRACRYLLLSDQRPDRGQRKDDHALEEKILKELRLDGMINAKEEVIEHLEHQLSGTSVLNRSGK